MDDEEGGQAADHDAQWGHDWEQFGRLRAGADQWLAPLAALVQLYAAGSSVLPVREAGRRVIDALQAHDAVSLFVTQPGSWAARIRDDWPVWRSAKAGRAGKPATPALVGRAPLVHALGVVWARAATVADVHAGEVVRGLPATRVAVLVDDAAELFPELFQAPTVGSDAAANVDAHARNSRKSDAGGRWSGLIHNRDASWADELRELVFRVHYLDKRSHVDIGKKLGVSRTRVAQEIGLSKLKNGRYGTATWHPSAELLKECGLKQRPSAFPTVDTASAAPKGRIHRAA
jgi:hypothetical protein